MKRKLMLLVMVLGCLTISFAQPRGGRGGGFDPEERILREKDNVIAKIGNLSEDQLLLLDGIYDEFGTTFKETFEEARRTRNFAEVRPKMQKLQEEKNLLVKDVLDENQYAIYIAMMEKQNGERRRQAGNRSGRRDSVNVPDN